MNLLSGYLATGERNMIGFKRRMNQRVRQRVFNVGETIYRGYENHKFIHC